MNSDQKLMKHKNCDRLSSIPNHLAVIMDGNSRWAQRENRSRLEGHRAGAEAVRRLLKLCKSYGVEILTLFVLSTENWERPRDEVRALLALLVRYLRNELTALHEEGVCIQFIGDRSRLPNRTSRLIASVERITEKNSSATLVLAVDYGGHWDITETAKYFAKKVAAGSMSVSDITPDVFEQRICQEHLPPPDLCIRTGGEKRLSNFMLWQLAYTELYFCETLWPDFDEQHLHQAFSDFTHRDRRYGRRIALDGIPIARDHNV